MYDLSGRIAIVTGASKGIGAEIARSMAAAGAAVTVNFVTGKVDAERVVAQIMAAGGRAIAVRGNVALAADVEGLVTQTIAAFGPPDILVNNAATFAFQPLEDIREEDFHAHFNVNVLGALMMAKAVVAHMSDGGCIINIGSAGIQNAAANSTLYATSKAAMDMITLVLAQELGERRIRVNTIRPGATETEGNHRLGTMDNEAVVKMLIGRTAMQRFGQPSDIAPAALFLASDDAAWITGEIIDVSGGYR